MINEKNILLKTMPLKFIIALSSLAPGFCIAYSENTIHFLGDVVEETCSISVNGSSSAPVILMPTVSKAELDKGGKTAGKVSFTISLSGCSKSQSDSKVFSTLFVANKATNNGNISNMGSVPAGNVEIQLLDPSERVINFNSNYFGNGDLNNLSATYHAQYYATAAASSGNVAGVVQYAVIYQ